jgi:hypothetical protein
MDLLDRVGQKTRDKKSPDQLGLFQPQGRKAKTLLLAWLFTSLKAFWGRDPWHLSANGTKLTQHRSLRCRLVTLGGRSEVFI